MHVGRQVQCIWKLLSFRRTGGQISEGAAEYETDCGVLAEYESTTGFLDDGSSERQHLHAGIVVVQDLAPGGLPDQLIARRFDQLSCLLHDLPFVAVDTKIQK